MSASKIRHSFNKMSHSYAKNCALQNEVAKVLVEFCDEFLSDSRKIIDLGAGSGNIAKNLGDKQIDFFLAIDNAPNMIALHPQNLPHIARMKLLCYDFEDYDFGDDYDLVLSSSALQWAKDLDLLFKRLVDSAQKSRKSGESLESSESLESKKSQNLRESKKSRESSESKPKRFAFAIFTRESLSALHAFLGTTSPLKSATKILAITQKYFCVESKMQKFSLNFSTRDEFLAYLKNGGLLGGGNLSFAQKKRLRFGAPFVSADFEVLFVKGVIR